MSSNWQDGRYGCHFILARNIAFALSVRWRKQKSSQVLLKSSSWNFTTEFLRQSKQIQISKKIRQCKHLFIIKRHGDKAKFPCVLPNILKITDFFITNKTFHQKFLPSDSGWNSEIWNCPGSLTNVKFHRSIKVFEGDLNLEKICLNRRIS